MPANPTWPEITAHPFLWNRGRLTDLGTLGGTFGIATWMNNAGEVAGGASTRAEEAFHAFFWRKGKMADLGTINGDTSSVAHFTNSPGQVVAGSVYSHFTGKDQIITAIADDVIATITATAGAARPGGEPPSPGQALHAVLAALAQADIAPIAVIIWGEAIRNPALGQRLSALYTHLAARFTELVRLSQARGTTDPATPAEHTALVLTAQGPAFLHQLAFGPGLDAATFTQGLRALTRH